MRGSLREADSSKVEFSENQVGDTDSSSRGLEVASVTYPPTQSLQECVARPAPPRSSSTSREYNSICKTHKRLVKSGAVKCSVSLSDTPPTVDLPPAPISPLPVQPLLAGSTHFGAIGDLSGVQTPFPSPASDTLVAVPTVPQPAVRGVSVIRSAPPALLPRFNPSDHQPPLHLPPKPVHPHHTPVSSRTGAVSKRLSSTDPGLLDYSNSLSIDGSIPSLDTAVFWPGHSLSSTVQQSNSQTMSQQEQQDSLKSKARLISRLMKHFKEEDLTTSRLGRMEVDLARIRDKVEEYQEAIEIFLDDYSDAIGSSIVDEWNLEIDNAADAAKRHADKIRTRAAQITAAATGSNDANATRALEIHETTLQLQQLSINDAKETAKQQQLEKESRELLSAEAEANILMGECSVLGDMMGLEVNWEDAEDNVISNGMRSMARWQEQMNTIERAFRKYENMKYKFSSDRQEAVQLVYDEAKQKFQTARSSLAKEDADRGLYTMEPVRSDIIKYPLFSGLPSEDLLKFMETMRQRFKENKVKKKEQVAKLRECLNASALGRVPDGITDIEEAFKRLQEAFGNPSKVMNHTLKALEELGLLPPDKLSSGQYNYAKQIEWLLRLEVILTKIIDLSARNSKLAHEAFSSSTYRKLWARFPTSHIQKLVKVQ